MTVAPVTTGPLGVEDLEGMPDDGRRHELVEGVLVVTPAPGAAHQDCVLNLAVLLRETLPPDLKVMLSPFDWVAGADTVFQPDLLVARRADVGPQRLEHAPVLVVEVLSRSTRLVDLGLKRAAYAEAGVPAYWVVDPDEPGLTAFRLAGTAYEVEASVTGDEPFEAGAPCPVTVVPAQLSA